MCMCMFLNNLAIYVTCMYGNAAKRGKLPRLAAKRGKVARGSHALHLDVKAKRGKLPRLSFEPTKMAAIIACDCTNHLNGILDNQPLMCQLVALLHRESQASRDCMLSSLQAVLHHLHLLDRHRDMRWAKREGLHTTTARH